MNVTLFRTAFAEAGVPCRNLIRKNADLSVRRQCELLQVNRSSVYYETKEPTETQRLLKEEIMARIDYWHTELPAMGSRKIAAKLRDEGYKVGRKLVRAYMREMEIYAIYPKPNLSKNDGKEGVVPYLLRHKTALFPNQYWSIDITYIKMYRHHMYLAAIIDWYSRKIVGWRLADTLETYHVLEAVRDAVERYGTPAILNSDQGSQFTSKEYRSLLKEYHITQSMDGRKRWADNIMVARWFRSLKQEEIYINEYRTPRELRHAVGEYIRKYNTIRPHQALDNKTPDAVYYASFSRSATITAGLDSAPLAC